MNLAALFLDLLQGLGLIITVLVLWWVADGVGGFIVPKGKEYRLMRAGVGTIILAFVIGLAILLGQAI